MPHAPHKALAATAPEADTAPAEAEETGLADDLIAALKFASPVVGAGLISFAAQLSVPFGDYGVPFTFSDIAVVTAAYLLGPKRGVAAILIYLAAGALGVPVFAEGNAGYLHLIGNTAGYLFGFLACQPVVGLIIRGPDRKPRGWGALILAFVAAQSIIYACGVPVLWLVNPDVKTLGQAIKGGMLDFLPFIPIKCGIAVIIARLGAPWAMRRIW